MSDPRKNRSEYQRRVNRVIDHIQAHRAEALSLETLAAVAAFSPFHFHRVFKVVTGETVNDFVQRIRLEGAASALLLRPDTDILTIALDNGFHSASAFARAFKERFGMPASKWRAGGCGQRRKPGQANSKPGQANSKPGQPDGNPGKEVAAAETDDASRPREADQEDIMSAVITVTTLPSTRIAYIRNVGPYGPAGGIPDSWRRLRQWAALRDLWTTDRVCMGIIHDDPTVTEPARCRHDAAIVVPEDFPADDRINTITLDGGKFATAAFQGSAPQIGKGWHDLFLGLTRSGFQPAHGPLREVYRGEAVDEKTGVVTCDLCVPVAPL